MEQNFQWDLANDLMNLKHQFKEMIFSPNQEIFDTVSLWQSVDTFSSAKKQEPKPEQNPVPNFDQNKISVIVQLILLPWR